MNELMRVLLFLPEQASTGAEDIDKLHYFVITVTMTGALAVGLACTIFLVRYRRGAGRGRELAPDLDPRHTSGGIPYWVEGAVYGGLFVLFLGWWIIGFRQYVHARAAPEGASEVYVIGKKWMWSFAYPDGTGTNHTLYVPVNRPVKLIMTSRDVIHSFFVPAFRVKQDVIPGRTTTLWFEATRVGTYPLYCTEYCGTGHSTMLGRVVVLSAVDYEERVGNLPPDSVTEVYQGRASATWSMADRGKLAAAEHGCLRCHTPDGTPHVGPSFARLYGSTVPTTGGPMVVDEAYLTRGMMDPLAEVHIGYQPVMPSYRGKLGAAEVAALVEYIRSLADVPRGAEHLPMPRDSVLSIPPGEGGGAAEATP